MSAPNVTIEQMKPKLLALDHVRELLARSEPVAVTQFEAGKDVRFELQPGWQHGIDTKTGTDAVDATITFGPGQAAKTYPLSKDALLEVASLSGLRKGSAEGLPAHVLMPHLNYWFTEGLPSRAGKGQFQILTAGETVAAFTKSASQPFSNVRLMEQLLNGIESYYGKGEVLVDYKMVHTLRRTHLRLIVPGAQRVMTGTGVADDTWSTGIQLKNSLTGEDKTSIDGYLFRWWCTNGAIDTHATSGAWTRRSGGNDADIYEWARHAVDEVIGGLEPALDAVQDMVGISIEGNANDVLRDVFEHYRVPVAERTRIIENMVEAGDLTMYSVMAAITQVANTTTMDPAHVENLLRMGGDLPHAAQSRCDGCRRLLPH